MACSSCGTKNDGLAPTGCGSKGNCGTGGCNALNVYDWFKDMDLPNGFERFNIIEVRYKGSRKEYYRNTENLELYTGDYVITEGALGYDLGTISAMGEIVRLQLKKQRIREDSDLIRKVLRKATEKDIEKFDELKARENSTLERARTISFDLNLAMKLSDIEIQGDGRKATFFYTAESRVDFRELIRKYADEFRLKIEMRHISYREEASRLGGIGDCGRQLCCSTWLTDYKIVNTGAARVQNLSINMEKLAGQCGRLKCCLNYELDTYVEAMGEFPKAKIVKIDTVAGTAYGRKSDILKRLMWFAYEDNPNWIPLTLAQVNEFMDGNKEGKQAPNLTELVPANQVSKQIAMGEEAEIINNEQLLQEDKEFEEEMRRKREKQQHSKGNNQPRGRDQQRNNDRRGRDQRGPGNNNPQNSDQRGEPRNQGDNRNNRPPATGPKPNTGQQTGPKPHNHQGNRPNHNRNRNQNRRNDGPQNKGPQTPPSV
ncbi:MAG: hypothetical protein IT244_05150 [Bacteroidia bacterium]|nr:hypothetical protein [Bacteroidia bacterium]